MVTKFSKSLLVAAIAVSAFIISPSASALPANGDIYHDSSQSYNLYTKTDTNNLTNPDVFYSDSQYSFSPNGKLIAYRTQKMTNNSLNNLQDVVITNAAGTMRRVVAKDLAVDTVGGIQWSPDGTKVAYGVMTIPDWGGSPGYPYQIGYANVDGSGAKIIPNFSIPNTKYFGGLTWINGSKIGVVTDIKEFCQVQLTGAKSCKQMPGFPDYFSQVQYLFPKVSPDGKKILFQRLSGWINDPDPQGPIWTWYDIWKFNIDGTGGYKLTTSPIIDSADDRDSQLAYNMVWSPDGTKIAYAYGQGNQNGLYVMDASGANKRKYDVPYISSINAWRAR